WTSGSNASINATGLAKGENVGVAQITASGTYGGVSLSGSANLIVTPAKAVSLDITPLEASVPEGGTQQFIAEVNMTDGSTNDVTYDRHTSWVSSNILAATVNNGLAEGVASGNIVEIKTTYQSLSATAQLTVTDAEIVRIEVTPDYVSVLPRESTLLQATAYYTNNYSEVVTDRASWTGQDTSIATVESGLVTGVTPSTTFTRATLDGVESNDVTIMVPSLESFTIDQPVVELSDRTPSTGLTYTGHYANGEERDVTDRVTSWEISDGQGYDGEALTNRLAVTDDGVISTGPLAENNRNIKEESSVSAYIDDLKSVNEAVVLQCLSENGPIADGTCVKEFSHEANIGSLIFKKPSDAGLNAYDAVKGIIYRYGYGGEYIYRYNNDPSANECDVLAAITEQNLRAPTVSEYQLLISTEELPRELRNGTWLFSTTPEEDGSSPLNIPYLGLDGPVSLSTKAGINGLTIISDVVPLDATDASDTYMCIVDE
ncbi:Ig-like domain-containing protein, partial [Vibrio parahaemolyticus]|nr:Ig-like domain-containing protein [Vibrio parahaemolyticus]